MDYKHCEIAKLNIPKKNYEKAQISNFRNFSQMLILKLRNQRNEFRGHLRTRH